MKQETAEDPNYWNMLAQSVYLQTGVLLISLRFYKKFFFSVLTTSSTVSFDIFFLNLLGSLRNNRVAMPEVIPKAPMMP